MRRIDRITKKLIGWILVFGFFIVSVNAEDPGDHTFWTVQIRDALQVIAVKYGVTIISDPALTGIVNGTVHGNDSVEEAIRTIIEPLGYCYTKVENYYLVSGPQAPLPILAETGSALVPVGYINPDFLSEFGEYRQYLTFDQASQTVFVKAPTSILNKILTAIWKAPNTASQISILYNLQIVDLKTTADLDSFFSGAFDSAKTGDDGFMIAPGELGLDGRLSVFIRDKISCGDYSFIRQPWLVTLPGKTVQIRESLHYLYDNNNPNPDRSFTLKLTPIQVDDSSGKISSEVGISGDEGHICRVSGTICSDPGSYELLAVVRQTEHLPSWNLLGRKKTESYHDFAVLLAATPLNVQQTLVENNGVLQIASLKGGFFEVNAPRPVTFPSKPELEIGLSLSKMKPENPWFHLTDPFNSQTRLEADYRNSGLYSLRLASKFESSGGAYLDFVAGKGIGPGDKAALMVGIGDRAYLSPYFTLFGVYYPDAYLFESNQYFERNLWSAGASLESGKFGLTVEASGNPDFTGWGVKMELTDSKASWIMEANLGDQDPSLYMGMGLKF